jgi:hypothetical protein
MTTRKRPPSGNGFSPVDSEEKALEVESVVEKNLVEPEAPVKIKVAGDEVEMVKPATEEVKAPKLGEKPKLKVPEKNPNSEVHVNPEPNKVGELIRPRRNVPRFVK